MTDAVPLQQPSDVATDYAAMLFVIQQQISKISSATLAKVVACTRNGDAAAWGTVDVLPIIGQVAGNGQVIYHKNLFRVPYLRIQGGTNAVIIDPEPGDIGIVQFASRDISALKQQDAIDRVVSGKTPGVPPGSARQFDMSDGLYLGGLLNGTPVQYVAFSDEGIRIISPNKVRIEAPVIEGVASTSITLQSPTITLDGDVHITGETTGDGDGTFEGISVHDHTHGDVTPGSGSSGPPNA